MDDIVSESATTPRINLSFCLFPLLSKWAKVVCSGERPCSLVTDSLLPQNWVEPAATVLCQHRNLKHQLPEGGYIHDMAPQAFS